MNSIPYIRDPQTVAEYISESYGTHNVAFYGDGLHTAEVLKCLPLSMNVSVICQDNISWSYERVKVDGFDYVNSQEASAGNFDYIFLLGVWTVEAIENLRKSLKIPKKKIVQVYAIHKLRTLIFKKFCLLNQLKLSDVKPNLLLLIDHDRKDFITVAAEEISRHFNMIKIFFSKLKVYSNDSFSQTLFLEGDISLFKYLIDSKKGKIDIVVYWSSCMREMCRGLAVKNMLDSSTKFVFATTDIYFGWLYPTLSVSQLGGFQDMTREFATQNAECEKKLLTSSDAVITNFCGEYQAHLISKNINAYFCFYFLSPKYFLYEDIPMGEYQPIKLCYAGQIEISNNIIKNTMNMGLVFSKLLKQDFEIDVYCTRNIENDSSNDYKDLRRKYPRCFRWQGFVESRYLPDTLKLYHFGLVLLNASGRFSETQSYAYSSIFLARIITYLGAGIPILVSREYELAINFVRQWGVGIVVGYDELDNLADIVRQCDYSVLKANVQRFQKHYKEQNYGEQLSDFLINL